MDLAALRVHDLDNCYGSLSLSLQALLRWAGADVRYHAIDAALGMPLRATAARAPACLGTWNVFATDAYLVPAAAGFGVTLRDLHPPAAAAGLADHAPFGQHFDASYAPLVRRALEHRQPVLAWRGWPDARAAQWGIITETSDVGMGFAGTTIWSDGKTVPLVRPPVQLYVVEDVSPAQPDDSALFAEALARFASGLNNAAVPDADVVTGLLAHECWLERLAKPDVCPTCGTRGARCHVQHARLLHSQRAAAVRFFNHYRDGADGDVQALIDAAVAECRGVSDALAASRDHAVVEVLVTTGAGREALATGVRAAASFERALLRPLEQLARRTERPAHVR